MPITLLRRAYAIADLPIGATSAKAAPADSV